VKDDIMNNELIFLKPVFKQVLWGGNRLKTEFCYDIPGNDTGECWAISAHEHGDCTVAGGQYAGHTLSWLWENHRELFGGYPGDRFPLLIKIIDAQKDLSIQVHPDDSYAREHENGALGKTECWYVLGCREDASIVIGHNAKTREELKTMIDNKKWKELIREVPIHKGDFFQIDPGCVHAIKGGTLILETQQSSDITYRVYDYDRLLDGKPRQLHVEQSKSVITVPYEVGTVKPIPQAIEGGVKTHLVDCKYYSVDKYEAHGELDLRFRNSFTNVSIIEGCGSINGISLPKGTHFIIPGNYGNCCFKGSFTMICSNPA
jgi:mannose-6-phosphate isomerase class I